MKFICVKIVNDVKTDTKIKKQLVKLQELEIIKEKKSGIYELTLSLSMLNSRIFENDTFIGKLKSKSIDKKVIKCIKKMQDENTLYILPKLLYTDVFLSKVAAVDKITEYLQYIFNVLDIKEYKYVGDIKKHLSNYIEYYTKVEKILPQKGTALVMYKHRENIDFNIVKYLINIFKNVEIYLEEKTSDTLNRKIEDINLEYGSSIKCISRFNNPKTYYVLCIAMDSNYSNFRRHKILNTVSKIELYDNDLDMFDENLLKVKEYEKTQDLIKENIRDLSNTYGKLKIASILVKILQLRA